MEESIGLEATTTTLRSDGNLRELNLDLIGPGTNVRDIWCCSAPPMISSSAISRRQHGARRPWDSQQSMRSLEGL